MKFRTIIIDDESLVRKDKKRLFQNTQESRYWAKRGSVTEAAMLVTACKPDLLFLYIQLTDATSFDLLKQLKSLPQVITYLG
jgi:two-component system, LytTR family, response regulator